MKQLAVIAVFAISQLLASYAQAQGNVAGTAVAGTARTSVAATCPSGKVIPAGTPIPDANLSDPQSYFCGSGGSSSPSVSGLNPNLQAAFNTGAALGAAFAERLRAAAARRAAEQAAEQQRMEAERARQHALEEQRRQKMFERLSQELMGITGSPQLQLMGVSSGPGLQLMGVGKSPDLQLMGSGNSTTASNENLKPMGTCFFGSGGSCGASQGPPDPTGDPNVVDLRDLQQGVGLAAAAVTLPPDQQQPILDQALDAANGDKTVQVSAPAGAPVPVISEDGLLAFQKANAEYRQARDSSYQLRKAFEDAQKQCEMGDLIAQTSQAQLEADLQNNMDQMSLAQKQQALAKIFKAALDQDLACGNTRAQLAASLENTDWTRYQAEEELRILAKKGSPDPSKISAPPKSDLALVLPFDSAPQASKADMALLEDTILGEPIQLSTETLQFYPPAVVQKYRSDPAFAQEVNRMHTGIFSNLSKDYDSAVREAANTWQTSLATLTQKSAIRPDIPLAAQERANPQLHLDLQNLRQQIRSRYDYECQWARYRAENDWSNWVETQDASLTGKPAPLYRPLP